jgi:autotransporter-associated beta strand protein
VDTRGRITFITPPTLSGGIIGPWATVNGSYYATLSGNDVVAYTGSTDATVTRKDSGTKAIPDSATADVRIIEGTGTLGNNTLAATTTTINSLLQSILGGVSAATVTIGASETLQVNSVNQVATAGAMTVGNVVNTGTLKPATAGGNLLLVNGSANNMTVNSVIADNTAASTVTKDGAGVLRLPGNNTYSGGTVINAGYLVVKADANLGAANTGITFNGSGALSFGNHPATGGTAIDLGTRPITINNGAVVGLYHNWANGTTTISGNITGDGGIIWGRDPVLTFGGGDGSQIAILNGTGNTFTGPLTVGMGSENIGVASYFRFNSLGNSANPITLNVSSIPFEFNSGAIANLSVPDRPVILVGSPTIQNLNGTYTMTLGPVSTTTAGAKTLNLGAGGAGGFVTGAVTDGAGSLSVAKFGAGTWTLSGANTYSGVTTISGGKLVGVVGGSCSNSAMTVSGGTLGVSVTDSTKQWTCKSLSHTAASTLEFAFGATVPGTSVAPLQVNGNVAFNVTPTVTCTGAGLTGLPAGAYPLVKWTGTTSGFLPSAVTLSSGSGVLLWDATNKTLWLILGNTRPAITWQGPAASEWKANESGYTYWKDAALADTYYQENTVGGLLGDSVVFGATGVGTVTLNTIVTPLAVSVNTASPNNYTISGSGGIAGGSLTKSGTSTLILATDNTYGGGTTISAGTLQVGDGGASGSLGSGSVLNNGTLIFNVTDSVTNGPISGTGSLTQNGSGILTLGGASTYSGATTVNSGALLLNTLVVNAFTSATTINSGGTLTLGAADLLVDTAAITVNGGGTFNLNGSAETIARVDGTGGIVTNSGALATLTMTGAGTRTISNVFRGNLNLSILGSSVITLTGSSTYTGSTTLGVNGTGGTKVLLGVNNALPVGTAASIGGSGDTIGFDLRGYSQALGPMTLNCSQNWATMEVTDSVGGGVLTLIGGATAVTSGTGNGSQGKISVTTLDLNNATQAFDVRNTFTITSLIQNGALTKTTGTGTLILSGNNTYAGSTLISAGTLQLNNKLALQNSPVDTTGAGTVNLNDGAGAYTLGGLNGSKNLALVITANLTNMTTLVLNPGVGVTNTYSGIIAVNGTMGLTKTGAGTQILSGVNTYSGKTVVSNGVLDVRDTATLSNSSGLQIDYDIATLRLENADNGGSPWTRAALLALEPNATGGATGPATELRFTVNGAYTDITAKKTAGTVITFF